MQVFRWILQGNGIKVQRNRRKYKITIILQEKQYKNMVAYTVLKHEVLKQIYIVVI